MNYFLGIDTSNYTTSAAVFLEETGEVFQSRRLLPVKKGELGLRQSDAVFHHTSSMPEIFDELFLKQELEDFNINSLKAVSASIFPRRLEGSYMPCFLVGKNACDVLSAVTKTNKNYFSHQEGHIAACFFEKRHKENGTEGFFLSDKRLKLLEGDFVAFHFSGGTSDCLLIENNIDQKLKVTPICQSLDLKAGQAVDRVGAILGLSFPAGRQLEKLALKSEKAYSPKPFFKDGCPSFSGVQNKCEKMLSDGESPCDIARFALDYISACAEGMLRFARKAYGSLPAVLCGGVMSNSLVKESLFKNKNIISCETELSSDNSTGIALLGYLKQKGII